MPLLIKPMLILPIFASAVLDLLRGVYRSILKPSCIRNCSEFLSLKFPQLAHFGNEVEIAFSCQPDAPLIRSQMTGGSFALWCNKPWAYRCAQKSVKVSNLFAARFDVIANRVAQSSAPLPLGYLFPVQHRIIDHHISGPLPASASDEPQDHCSR